jgi:hypothetical protein
LQLCSRSNIWAESTKDRSFGWSTKLVVARTRDGGRTFDVLREGLPQSHAYDVVYRHALAIAATGSPWRRPPAAFI